MHKRQVLPWGMAIVLLISFLAGCGRASPTPIVMVPAATWTDPPPPMPDVVQPAATRVPSTAAVTLTATSSTTTADESATPGTIEPTEKPLDRPFLMQIDRVSVIVGRGTLLEGTVVHGTLQANQGVEILGSQGQLLGTTVLAVFIANTPRDQVTVGDRGGVLVQSVEAVGVSPGMLLAEAGAFTSYAQALEQIQ